VHACSAVQCGGSLLKIACRRFPAESLPRTASGAILLSMSVRPCPFIPGAALLCMSSALRDVNPANVLIADDGRVKLDDFGISKLKRCLQPRITLNEFASPPYAPRRGTCPNSAMREGWETCGRFGCGVGRPAHSAKKTAELDTPRPPHARRSPHTTHVQPSTGVCTLYLAN
jgi:serine/threonine protein kinase